MREQTGAEALRDTVGATAGITEAGEVGAQDNQKPGDAEGAENHGIVYRADGRRRV